MDREFRKQEDINCKCQCHYPSNIICHITHCCHCIGNDYINPNERIPNNNSIQFSPSYNSQNSFYKNGKEQNNLMNSYSTYYRSGNESINIPNSEIDNYNSSISKNYYTRRKLQNQEFRQPYLQRNFSEPKFNLNNNDNDSQNNNYHSIINQEPYRNNNDSFYKNNNIINDNNSILMNDSINPLSQSQTNNNINNNNLTYIYKDNLNNPNSNNNLQERNFNNYNINNNINNKFSNPLDLTHLSHANDIDQLKSDLMKAHDIISILQKENEFLKSQRDGALNQVSANENIKNIDRLKFDELEKENNELKHRLNEEINQNKIKDNFINNVKEDINDLQNAIHDKDLEIQNLIQNMRKLEQDANNEINKLKNRIDVLN